MTTTPDPTPEITTPTGTDLIPHQDQTPDRPKRTFGSAVAGVLNFVTLSARFAALVTAALFLKEGLHLLKNRMHDNADTARRLSEMCGQAGVDERFQAQILEVSQDFDRVADASGELANAADQMETHAREVDDAHRAEYGGVHEVVNASPYEQPKPGFNAVR